MPDSPHSTAELRHARSKRAAEYYLANREKIRARQRETYWRNLEKSRAYGRAKYQRRREKTRLLAPFRYELRCVDCSRTIFSAVPFKKRCDDCRLALARKRHTAFNHSEAGRAARRRFRQSEKGRIARRRYDKIRRQKPGAKEKATAIRLAWREKNRDRETRFISLIAQSSTAGSTDRASSANGPSTAMFSARKVPSPILSA